MNFGPSFGGQYLKRHSKITSHRGTLPFLRNTAGIEGSPGSGAIRMSSLPSLLAFYRETTGKPRRKFGVPEQTHLCYVLSNVCCQTKTPACLPFRASVLQICPKQSEQRLLSGFNPSRRSFESDLVFDGDLLGLDSSLPTTLVVPAPRPYLFPKPNGNGSFHRFAVEIASKEKPPHRSVFETALVLRSAPSEGAAGGGERRLSEGGGRVRLGRPRRSWRKSLGCRRDVAGGAWRVVREA